MDELNIFGRNHIMFDLETLSQHQNATIISIGAVKFTFEDGLGEEFMMNVDPMSCVKLGLHVQTSTIEWWEKQSKEAQDAWKVDPKQIQEAVVGINNFIGSEKNQFIWAHGSVFDCGILTSAFNACKIEKKWPYYNEMDSRTIFNLFGIRNDKIRMEEGQYHTSLADAKSQARTLIGIFNG